MLRCLTGTGLALGVIATATGGMAAQQGASEPVAQYWVTADTQVDSIGGLGGALSMATGRSADARRTLKLQLVSRRIPQGAALAEHLPPAGLEAGKPLTLQTRRPDRPGNDAGRPEAPRGKVLVYWGCGESVRAGQPAVVDLARPGSAAAEFATGLGGFIAPPTPREGRTYGEWPNSRSGGGPSARGSLIGDHLVRGNYTPDIRFSLRAGQDFMPPISLSGASANAAGVTPLAWRSVSGAGGYFASVVGANDHGDTVIWSSSEIPLMAGQAPDHLSPDDLKRLIARKAVMGPETTRCAIPAQVGKAAPAALLRIIAYGGEASFSYPPRPSNLKAPWIPDYTVKVRYASTASLMLGLTDEDGDGGDEEIAEVRAGRVPPEEGVGKRARGLLKGLGTVLP